MPRIKITASCEVDCEDADTVEAIKDDDQTAFDTLIDNQYEDDSKFTITIEDLPPSPAG